MSNLIIFFFLLWQETFHDTALHTQTNQLTAPFISVRADVQRFRQGQGHPVRVHSSLLLAVRRQAGLQQQSRVSALRWVTKCARQCTAVCAAMSGGIGQHWKSSSTRIKELWFSSLKLNECCRYVAKITMQKLDMKTCTINTSVSSVVFCYTATACEAIDVYHLNLNDERQISTHRWA